MRPLATKLVGGCGLALLLACAAGCGDSAEDASAMPPAGGTGGTSGGTDGGSDVDGSDGEAGTVGDAAEEGDAGPDAVDIYHVPDTPPYGSARFGDAPGVIFRWRADGTSTTPGTLSAGVETITVTRPDPFSAFRYAVFQGVPTGVSPGYLADDAIQAQSVGFTIQAWFRARAVDGTRTLFSNTGGTRGLCLDLKDGNLQVAFSTDDNGAPYRHWVTAESTPIEEGQWYHAAVTGSKRSGAWRVAFFLDGALVLEQDVALDHGSDLLDSTELPAVAAEPNGAVLDGEGFDGDLHAVVVHNYPISDHILGAPQLREGGRYYGAPSYHDYLQVPEPAGTAGATPPYSDRRYNLSRRIAGTDADARFRGLRDARVRLGLPFLNDRYVPSGIALSEDGRSMWLGFYFVSDEGTNPDQNAAFLAETDLPSKQIVRVHRLAAPDGSMLSAPLGGVAFARGFLYVSSAKSIYRFNPASSVLESEPDADLAGAPAIHRLQADDSYVVAVSDASLSYDGQLGGLWLAAHSADAGALERYDLTTEGAIAHPSAALADEHVVLPSRVTHVRGALRIPGFPPRCFLVTSHDASNPASSTSRVFRWCEGQKAAAARLSLSGGAQGVTLGPDATVWLVHQSGAAFLQKRTNANPWYDTLTPYLLGFDPARLEPQESGCRTDAMTAFVGDVHTHTSYSDGIELPADLFAQARDVAGLDFTAITDHGASLTDTELSNCRTAASAATSAGSYAAWCGFEEAAKSSGGDSLGHANFISGGSPFSYPNTLDGLIDRFAACTDCIVQLNHPASVNYPWTDDTWVPKADSVVALAEFNGGGLDTALPKYLSLLDHGWHVAPSCNSDTHSLNPGSGEKRTGVFATSLEPDTILEAFRERRTFAGNAGNGAYVSLKAQGCWMGVRLQGHVQASVRVEASDPAVGFSTVELLTGEGEVLHTIDCAQQTSCNESLDLEIDPGEQKYIVALATRTDGHWLLSAPVWLED